MKSLHWLHFVGTLAAWAASVTASAQSCGLELISQSASGQVGNGSCGGVSLSGDGRWVAFASDATNLVPGDVNGFVDCFLKDRSTGAIEIVSLGPNGIAANGMSLAPQVSIDGRFIAFLSQASNLDPRDPDPVTDAYVYDRVAKTTTLVSERLGTGSSTWGCFTVSISLNGRYVAFDCGDDNVLPGDINPYLDVFVRDMLTQTTEFVDVGPLGQQANGETASPSISADGRFVAFYSAATNWFSIGPNYASPMSAGVFVRDRSNSTTIPVTALPSGFLADGISIAPAISADGRFVAFQSSAERLVTGKPFCCNDILRWDRLTGTIEPVCLTFWGFASTRPSFRARISANGRYVAFLTDDVTLTGQVMQGWNGIWKDMETGATVNLNVDPHGEPGNFGILDLAISGDGRVTAFVSSANNLLPGTQYGGHAYARACTVPSPTVYCYPSKVTGGCKALMGFQGVPSASGGSGFMLNAQGMDAQQPAVLFYGVGATWGKPLFNGRLCLRPPVVRAHITSSGGSTICGGTLSMDFNAWIASGVDPRLVPGQPVYAQVWHRNSIGASQLSDAVAFVVGP